MVDQPPPPAADGGPPGKRSPGLGDVFWLGTACVISIVGGGAIGYGLDAALGTSPWITIGGLAFGVISAVLLVVAEMRKYM